VNHLSTPRTSGSRQAQRVAQNRVQEPAQEAIILPDNRLRFSRRRPVRGQTVNRIRMQVQSAFAFRRIEVGPSSVATSIAGARHADGDAALAGSAFSIARRKVDGVDRRLNVEPGTLERVED
jgi:hypothetical protein